MTTLELLAMPGMDTSKQIIKAGRVSQAQSLERMKKMAATRMVVGRKSATHESKK